MNFIAILNPDFNEEIPADVEDALFRLQVRRSMSGDRNVSLEDVEQHLKSFGIDPSRFNPSSLLPA